MGPGPQNAGNLGSLILTFAVSIAICQPVMKVLSSKGKCVQRSRVMCSSQSCVTDVKAIALAMKNYFARPLPMLSVMHDGAFPARTCNKIGC